MRPLTVVLSAKYSRGLIVGRCVCVDVYCVLCIPTLTAGRMNLGPFSWSVSLLLGLMNWAGLLLVASSSHGCRDVTALVSARYELFLSNCPSKWTNPAACFAVFLFALFLYRFSIFSSHCCRSPSWCA